MAFTRATRLGIGGAALAVVAFAGIGSAPAPEQLPTVTVHHNPT